MDLKQEYREETNLEPYGDIDQKDNYTRHYVKWLEKQCTINVVSQQRELLIGFQLWEQYASNKGLTIEDYANHYLKQKGNL